MPEVTIISDDVRRVAGRVDGARIPGSTRTHFRRWSGGS